MLSCIYFSQTNSYNFSLVDLGDWDQGVLPLEILRDVGNRPDQTFDQYKVALNWLDHALKETNQPLLINKKSVPMKCKV